MRTLRAIARSLKGVETALDCIAQSLLGISAVPDKPPVKHVAKIHLVKDWFCAERSQLGGRGRIVRTLQCFFKRIKIGYN